MDEDNYGELRTGGGTDIQYRVRDDGEFVELFEPNGSQIGLGLRVEDVESMHADMKTDRSGTETDWLANSVYGYGFGYTKEQALAAMARHAYPDDADTVEVDLIEHVGGAKVGPGGDRVEEFVSGERVEIPAQKMRTLSTAAVEAHRSAEMALEQAESREEIER